MKWSTIDDDERVRLSKDALAEIRSALEEEEEEVTYLVVRLDGGRGYAVIEWMGEENRIGITEPMSRYEDAVFYATRLAVVGR